MFEYAGYLEFALIVVSGLQIYFLLTAEYSVFYVAYLCA